MSHPSQIPLQPASGLRVGHPAYSLLTFAAGTLLHVGTRATAYVSTLALAPHDSPAHPATA